MEAGWGGDAQTSAPCRDPAGSVGCGGGGGGGVPGPKPGGGALAATLLRSGPGYAGGRGRRRRRPGPGAGSRVPAAACGSQLPAPLQSQLLLPSTWGGGAGRGAGPGQSGHALSSAGKSCVSTSPAPEKRGKSACVRLEGVRAPARVSLRPSSVGSGGPGAPPKAGQRDWEPPRVIRCPSAAFLPQSHS